MSGKGGGGGGRVNGGACSLLMKVITFVIILFPAETGEGRASRRIKKCC